ncbi:MAG: hypothetical protein ACC628_19995 [Pirellulaceae bacterium]
MRSALGVFVILAAVSNAARAERVAIQLLSDKKTQDSDPAVCKLTDGRQLVVWRAFLGIPEPAGGSEGTGGDQIRGAWIDDQGNTGELFDVLVRPGDIDRIAAAPTSDGRAMVVWSEQQNGNWDLYSGRLAVGNGRVRCISTTRLTEDPGVDRSPVLAAEPDGSIAIVWQGWRGTRSSIFFRQYRDQEWQEIVCLSDAKTNDWNPVVAAASDGSVAVAWSRWQGESYGVCLRVRSQGEWTSTRLVANSERFEAHPCLAYDRQGVLWVAYEQGRAGWGMDSFAAGLRAERNVRLACYRNGQVHTPRGAAALRLPETLRDRSEMAQLATDGNGVLWLFFRAVEGRGVWNIYGTSLSKDGWTPPQKLHQSAGGQNVLMASGQNAHGRLCIVWSADHRVNAVGRDSWLYRTTMPTVARFAQPLQADPAPGVVPEDASDQEPERSTYELGGKPLRLYFGDLHRHTELSVCRTNVDGSLEDAYRYAIDASGLDFLCITDHVQHVKILNDYDFWRSVKTADLNRVTGLHQPFYGYERSQRFPYGHRNIISTRRNVKRVPRTKDNRPASANQTYDGEVRIPPPELWARLVGENVITIPHTSTSPVMGTDFGHEPTAVEPVVEIYQGCRYTAEYEGAPDPRSARDTGRYGGATQPEGYISNALSKGYRYGFIASSDHVATHNSYTCVWAEEFSNAAILDALAKRQCYAATDAIQCRMHMGPHLMGSEFTAEEVPPLDVDIVGVTDIERVDVIKDNQVVYVREPDQPSRHITFRYQDMQAKPGVHYYYARVIQEDRNMAWISPIWVNVKGATSE